MAKREKKRSLVTGACGFIGSHVTELLASQGHHVIAADHPAAWKGDSTKAARYPSLVRRLAAETHEIDLASPATLDPLPADVDYVFHVASVFSYSAPWDVLYRVNVEGTRALADRVAGSPRLKRWLQVGAGGVYGLPSERGNVEFTEELAPQPSNDYLRSKWQQEFHIMEQGRQGRLTYTIVRPTSVYGPRGGYGARQLVMGMDGAAVVAVPANLTGHAPYIHVHDLARACLHLVEHDGAANQAYNVSDDTDITNVEYMEMMARLLGRPFVKLPPLPLGQVIRALTPLLKLQVTVARDLFGRQAPLEPDMLAYFTEDFRFSNRKLKGTGFRFEYPDARLAFPETLAWYRAHNGREK